MRGFLEFLHEGVEPKKPVGKLVKKTVMKNRGTVHEKPLTQIGFVTTAGNDVKVQFSIREGEGDIVFYVNDTLDDRGGRDSGVVDPEILSGVLWVVDKYSDTMKLHTITFSAWAGEGDNKIVKGLDTGKPREAALSSLRDYMKDVESYEATIIPPSEGRIALAKKLGREPTVVYDVNVHHLFGILREMLYALEDESIVATVPFEEELYKSRNTAPKTDSDDILDFASYNTLEDLIPGGKNVLELLRKYNTAKLSNTESGASVNRNRRQDLYKRLIDKFFSDKWNVEQRRDSFTLTRKEEKAIAMGEDVVAPVKKPAASYSVEQLMFAMFDESFREYGQYYIPLFSHVIKKIFGDIQGYGWHLTGHENLERLKSIQGTNKSISTLHRKDIANVMDRGVASKADIAVLVRGNVLLKYDINAWTVVDENGNRWVPVVSMKTGKAIGRDIEALQVAYVRKLNLLAHDLDLGSWSDVHEKYDRLDEGSKKKLLANFVKSMEAFVLENSESIKENIWSAIDVSEKAMDEVETGFNEIVISDFEIVKVVPIETFRENRSVSDMMNEMPAWNDGDKNISKYMGDKTRQWTMERYKGYEILEEFPIGDLSAIVFRNREQNMLNVHVIDTNDKEVGAFNWYKEGRKPWATTSAAVAVAHQGKGMAYIVYTHMIDKYMHTLMSDQTLTGEKDGKGSFDLWVKLGKKYPFKYVYNSSSRRYRQVQEFTRDMMDDEVERFVISQYEI